MLVTPLDERYEAAIHIRPVKHVYFISKDDSTSLDRVARLSCSQWGGVRNLIVPVDDDYSITPLFLHFIYQAEPDKFVSFVSEDGFEAVNTLQEHLRSPLPDQRISVERGDSFERFDRSVYALDSFRSSGDLLEAASRRLSGVADRPSLSDPRLQASAVPEWMSRVIYGGIYGDQDEQYREGMDVSAEVLVAGTDQFWASQYRNDPLSSVLNLTNFNNRPHKVVGGWVDSNHIDVLFVADVADACLFWACRALRDCLQFDRQAGRRTLLFPASLVNDASTWESLTRFFVQHMWRESGQSSLDVVFYAPKNLHDDISEALSRRSDYERSDAGTIKLSHKQPAVPIDYTHRTLSYALKDPFVSIFGTLFAQIVQEGAGRGFHRRVVLHVGANHLLVDPSEQFYSRHMGQVAVDYESRVWSRYPSGFRVAEAIVPHAWFSRRGLTAIYGLARHQTELQLNLPDEWETLQLFFKGKGYAIRRSPDGGYADAVAQLLGGITGVAALASRHAYALLDILALRSSLKVAQRIGKRFGLDRQTIDQIAEHLVEVETLPELKGRVRSIDALVSDQRLSNLGRRGVLDLVDRLVRAGLLNRGYYLSCPTCGAPDWYPLDSLRDELVCSGCRSVFALPVQEPRGQEIQWQYRLNTLVNRAMDQDVIPNLLGLRAAVQGRQATCLATGLELVREGRAVHELDFVFVSNQRLHAGECKAGSVLESRDFAKAELAAMLGFEAFCFCSLGAFSESTLADVEACQERVHNAGHDLRISAFSGQQLFGETPNKPSGTSRVQQPPC